MTEPTSYTIRSISDLLDIPPDRLDDCLKELAFGVRVVHFAIAIAEAEGIENAIEGSKKLWNKDGITWTDDREKTIRLEMTNQLSE